MDHTVFQQIIALPAGVAENIFPLMGLQFHQQVEISPHQSANIPSHHGASFFVNENRIFPILFQDRDPGLTDLEQEFIAGQELQIATPLCKSAPKGPDYPCMHLCVGNHLYVFFESIKLFQ